MNEGAGRIQDRSREHLGAADHVIAACRKMMLQAIQSVAEGNDPPASAVATFQSQISGNQIKVLVYNVQAATAVTTNLKTLATARHIPNVGVTETLQPGNLTFQDWQLKQLQGLEAALKSTS